MRAVCAAAAVLCVVARWCVVAAAPDHKWYSSAPVLPALVASSEHIAHPRCYNHSRLFLRALDNYTLWAVQMLDASVKVPDGIVDGSVSHLGHFDECLAVSVDDLRGQYCLVELSFRPISYNPAKITDPYTLQYDPKIHAWEKLKESEDRTKVTRSTLYLGLCMPSSCTPDQLQDTLEHELRLLREKEGLIFKASVSPRLCTTEQESPPWSLGEIAYSCTVGLLILLVVISSCYAYLLRNNDHIPAVGQVLLCLSIQRSVKGLLKVPKHHSGLDCIDVYRLLFMIAIVFGHRFSTISSILPMSDANQQEQVFRGVANSLLANGAIIVDFYFLSSGILLSYNLLSYLQEHKSANLLIVIIVRFLRLTPVYMTVVFFHATLFYRMGSGPLWDMVVGVERDRCRDNWWTNLLYINNYVNTDRMCIVPSWYLSVDTQLFIFCLFMVYAVGRWPSWGYTLLATVSSLSVLLPLFNTWWKKEDALFILTPDAMRDVAGARYFHDMYVRTENRASPYFIGVIVGLILVRFRETKLRIKMIPTLLCFAALIAVSVGSVMASYPLYKPGSSHTYAQAGLYASLSRVLFSASSGSVFLLASFGTPGLLLDIGEWRMFRVLGRLVYGVYLTHYMGLLYDLGSLRVPIQTGAFHCLWMVMGDVMFFFCLSFLLTVLLESPVRALEKLIFHRESLARKEKPQVTVQRARKCTV